MERKPRPTPPPGGWPSPIAASEVADHLAAAVGAQAYLDVTFVRRFAASARPTPPDAIEAAVLCAIMARQGIAGQIDRPALDASVRVARGTIGQIDVLGALIAALHSYRWRVLRSPSWQGCADAAAEAHAAPVTILDDADPAPLRPEEIDAESLRASFRGPIVEADEWRPLRDHVRALVALFAERAVAVERERLATLLPAETVKRLGLRRGPFFDRERGGGGIHDRDAAKS